MTFDEWAKSQNSKYKTTDDSMLLRQLRSCWQAAVESREPLYRAVNAMMAHLGAHGEIDTRSPLVTAVMDALHDVDGGVYRPAKDIDMEDLKRGQDNASKAWAGVDVQKFLQREPQPMPLEKAEELAHRTASRYTHKSDRSFTAYTFLPHTLEDFVRKVERFHGIGEC